MLLEVFSSGHEAFYLTGDIKVPINNIMRPESKGVFTTVSNFYREHNFC